MIEATGETARQRVVIDRVRPEIDGGRFAIKRTAGEKVRVEADVFTDGHDSLGCLLLYRDERTVAWSEVAMEALGNDRWRGELTVSTVGRWRYTVTAWVDHWKTWRRDLRKRLEARQDVSLDLLAGAALIQAAAERVRAAGRKSEARVLAGLARALGQGRERDIGQGRQSAPGQGRQSAPGQGRQSAPGQGRDDETRLRLALDEELAQLMDRHADRSAASTYRELAVIVDRERARFSSWYEMFPRSCSPVPGRHGTFRDLAARLPYVADMGFDVLYLPPIHPIGVTNRKGKNNAKRAEPGDVGSPWAIGLAATEGGASEGNAPASPAAEGAAGAGGHKSIHPELGTAADFRWLVGQAREHGVELALDVAFQCSPDHPYVREHPEWFRKRPDGTIQYAENPPKKYEDIYPFDFEGDAWRELWDELKSIFLHWIGEGVRIFRVDNPHTKPFAFWEWVIGEVKRDHPDVIFLAEAFTRPKLMYRLAKLGFTQSYNYFPWRTNRWELTEYFTELTRTEVAEFFRPSLWPNTPDILTEQLQFGGRPAFIHRLVLAATLGASYGIYGPPYELLESRARERGSEEYLDSEKYQLRHWDLGAPHGLRDLIALLNRVRRENPALKTDATLRFHTTDNEQLLCYSKTAESADNTIVAVVNLDPHHVQSGWVELDLARLGLDAGRPFQAHDLLTGARFLWSGSRNFVQLDPQQTPAHLFRVRRRVRSEQDFDYFQ